MTIWILTLVLLASMAGIGYRQGVFRVVSSLAGIFAGALLAWPLSKLVRPVMESLGLKQPVVLWLTAPIVVFVIVLCLFKIAGQFVHFYAVEAIQNKNSDVRVILWHRLIARLGLCLALVNGAAYLSLLGLLIYPVACWTVQLDSGKSSKTMRLINRLGWDSQRTGLTRIAKAMDPLPNDYYQAADLAGLLFHHPLAEARLARYPGLLSLGEAPEFQDISHDSSWMQMRLQDPSIDDVLNHPKAQAILQNPDTLRLTWATLQPDLADLRAFIETGKSEKYDSERILGRWMLDLNGTAAAYRKAKPGVVSSEMQRMKTWFAAAYGRMVLVLTPDHLAFMKDIPAPAHRGGGASATASAELQTLTGQWQGAGNGQYELSLASGANQKARFEGTRLFVSNEALTLVLQKEE